MFTNWLKNWRKRRPQPAPRTRLGMETLEARETPAHLNPGVGVVDLPAAAVHGAHGIETANDAPADHHRPEKILID